MAGSVRWRKPLRPRGPTVDGPLPVMTAGAPGSARDAGWPLPGLRASRPARPVGRAGAGERVEHRAQQREREGEEVQRHRNAGPRGESVRAYAALWAFVLLSTQGVAHAGESRASDLPGPGLVASPDAGTAGGDARATALEPGEQRLWAGDWLMTGSDLEANVYSIFRIRDVRPGGFSYELDCRDVPYGPNAVLSGEARARFLGPLDAANPENGTHFRLTVRAHEREVRPGRMGGTIGSVAAVR